MLPSNCPLCKSRVQLDNDPWHWLTCAHMRNGELTRRHDAVVEAISCVARQVGAQVRTEVTGLNPCNDQRPDLQIVFPGRMLLSDVSVSHTLTPAGVASLQSQASKRQSAKKSKYASVASRLGAELLNVVVDTSGGMTADALRLIQAVGEEGEKWSAGTWTSAAIRRHLTGAVAIGLQRGNAIAMLSGYSRTACGSTRGRNERGEGGCR